MLKGGIAEKRQVLTKASRYEYLQDEAFVEELAHNPVFLLSQMPALTPLDVLDRAQLYYYCDNIAECPEMYDEIVNGAQVCPYNTSQALFAHREHEADTSKSTSLVRVNESGAAVTIWNQKPNLPDGNSNSLHVLTEAVANAPILINQYPQHKIVFVERSKVARLIELVSSIESYYFKHEEIRDSVGFDERFVQMLFECCKQWPGYAPNPSSESAC